MIFFMENEMKTAIALRHLNFENVGLIESVLFDHDYKLFTLDATLDEFLTVNVEQIDLVIILGGPIGVYDGGQYPFIKNELKFVEHCLKKNRPLMGICLGAQMIATVMGAKVNPMGRKEIGFSQLELTEDGHESPLALIGNTPVLHWHGDQFDIPHGAKRLAQTAICPHQAFSYNNILALQFHLEANLNFFEHWLVGHACELAQAKIDPVVLRNNAETNKNALQKNARKIFSAWFDSIEK